MQAIAPLEAFLLERLFGQADAIREFSSAVERAEHGPRRQCRPRAFLLLLGPTGTGKTEMVKLAAQFLYGDACPDRLERFDMGEYQHADSVLRLLGSPGQPALLGAAVDRLKLRGGGILLLDEIEKAHPDLLTVLLSFDDARTTMADGSTKDLSGCYVIMTSNLGAAEAALMANCGYSAIRRKVVREAEAKLRKETVARFTSVIVMNILSFDVQERIVRRLLETEIALQSGHCRRHLEIAGPGVVTFLIGKGFSPDMGARHIRGIVERYVGDALRLYSPNRCSPDAECEGEGLLGDRWTRGLVIEVQADALVSLPLRRSDAFSELLARHGALTAPTPLLS
ncbi:MAG: AAA family ATPase [Opitutaceae bacterium]|jgi:ATP-dependent Clp protease ATP-binding subunit ClpB